MNSTINLEAYLERIGCEGPVKADFDTLCKLQKLHPQAIPFENLNPLLGIPVKLDLKSLQQKLIHDSRGGYCFEHNLLFKQVLESIGFEVKPLGGRVIWGRSADAITSRTHMVNLVRLNDKNYLTDVGFGGNTCTAPLLLEPDLVQKTPHEPYRMIQPEKQYYILEAKIREEWKILYRFTLQRQFMIDYKVANWYTSTHPDSHFVTDLTAARAGEQCRYVVSNNNFTIHHLNRKSEHRALTSADELRDVLENVIGLNLPEIENLENTLEKISNPAPS